MPVCRTATTAYVAVMASGFRYTQCSASSFQYSVFSFGSQGFDEALEHGRELFELGGELAALFGTQKTDAFSNQFSVCSFQCFAFICCLARKAQAS
jgi:hypothetical protein